MKITKKLVFFMILLLCSSFFTPSINSIAKTKKGMYVVEGYFIKSINKSGNKFKIVTEKGKQLLRISDDNTTCLKGKSYKFTLDKKVKFSFVSYNSDKSKKTTLNNIKKAIKKSKKYKEEYELAREDDFIELPFDELPFICFNVNSKGKITDVLYHEGIFDNLK